MKKDINAASTGSVSRAAGIFTNERLGPVVETAEGKLRGTTAGQLNIFRGIHYGESTHGTHRFRPPVSVTSWSGVRQATALGDPCFQHNPDWQGWKESNDGSEECLVLNVWAPMGEGKKPVMVFLHGGAYFYGSGGALMYDGGRLAQKGDVVVVSVNHRLHMLGFMHLADLSEQFEGCSNAGLLDLVAALRWIQRNIAAFGGDPDTVTLFGESGGGAKVCCLMSMPIASGLFHKAIVQSGSQLHVRAREAATADAEAALKMLAIPLRNLAALQSVPLQVIWDTYSKISENSLGSGLSNMPFSPVLDSETLPFHPGSVPAMELSKNIALIVGYNEAEGIFYLDNQGLLTRPESDAGMIEVIQKAFPKLATAKQSSLSDLVGCYRQSAPDGDLLGLSVSLSSELWMGRDAIQQADDRTRAGCASVYLYRFGWQEPCFGAYWAIHGAELPFIFDKLEVNHIWGDDDTLAARQQRDPEGKRYNLRESIIDAWTSFARLGTPVSSALPNWAVYALKTRPTMRLDADSQVINDPLGPALRTALASLDVGVGS